MEEKKPNPGSLAAQKMGCTCPVMDNGYGHGAYGKGIFWINEGCPLHDIKTYELIKEVPYKLEPKDDGA